MGKFAIVGFVAAAFSAPALADEPIRVTGCVEQGVEAGCLTLRTAAGKVYNIAAAKPKPLPGAYGEVVGTVKDGAMSMCMQGPVIAPATWTAKGTTCPK